MPFDTEKPYFCSRIMRTLPKVTKNLLIINVLMYLATWVMQQAGPDLSYVLGLYFFMLPDFHPWQLLTYMFMHGGLGHLFFNMLALWMFGCVVENTWGARRFLIYYMACGIGAGLIQELTQFVSIYFTLSNAAGLTVGASGAIYGVLLAFGMLYPNERIFIFPLPIPIKAKWFITFYIVLELFMAVSTSGDGVAHTAHLGGMLVGYLLIRYWKRHPYGGGAANGFGKGLFDDMRRNWEKRKGQTDWTSTTTANRSGREENVDWEYNAKKKADQDEIDRILDKIRRSGYDSLTEKEKRKLFESGD